jgi:hypothetical protein
MNRRDLETLLLTLESTPALVAKAAAALDASQVRQVPAGGGFSLLEHVWHLADLEREGYGVRIRRILSESEPPLSDFEGERIARERCYSRRDLAEGLPRHGGWRGSVSRSCCGVSAPTRAARRPVWIVPSRSKTSRA